MRTSFIGEDSNEFQAIGTHRLNRSEVEPALFINKIPFVSEFTLNFRHVYMKGSINYCKMVSFYKFFATMQPFAL